MIALVAVVVALIILVFFAPRLRFRADVPVAAAAAAGTLLGRTMFTFAVFGIDNDALNTAVNVLILLLIVIWAALVFWTFADARRRIDDPMLVACATLASLFPFVGRSST